MTLSPQFLDELRARTLLSALIAKSVKLQKAGREFKGCCPFHNEKTPSFYVNDDKAFYHCFPFETKVVTRSGRREIGALAGSTAEILSRGGKWIPGRFRDFGTQRLWRIALSRNGVKKTIFATEGHRWFVHGRAREVLTRDLRPGHRLASVLPPRRESWTLDPEGIRHGIIFGDGTLYKRAYGTINLHGEKDAALACWFPDQEHHQHERSGGKPYLRIYGGRAFGSMKAFPALSMSDEYLLGFLAGYLAADGHVAKDGTVILNSADADALEFVRDLAPRLGIATYGRTTLMRRGFGAQPSALHRIHFVVSTLDSALFLLPQARARFEAHGKAFDRLRWAVESVAQSDRVEPVYCAEVPGEHAFALEDNILTGNCFGCGAHGDAIRWMTDQRGLPFIDAVKELAQAAGMEMPAPDPRAAQKAERTKGLHEASADAADWFVQQLNGIAGAEARSVLERRGISAATAKTFALGYAPDSRGRLKAALKEYGDTLLVEAGLLIDVDNKEPYDRFRGRLMIPIRDPRGRVIAFGGRIIGDGEPKYLNSPETPLFDKGRTLYNLDRAAPASRKTGRVLVVEGYMDVIALAQAGIEDAVAPLGTALTEGQLERLWRLVDVPILCFDGDAAGQKAAIRAATRALPMLAPGRSLAFVTLPQGLDPDDLVREGGATAFEALLEKAVPLVEHLWAFERDAKPLGTPEERASLGKRLREHAKSIGDEDTRREYLGMFNRMVWDFFHPERPSKSFTPFSSKNAPKRPIAPRLLAISQNGIDQVTYVPALIKGLMRFPSEIAPLAETFSELQVNSIKLRQVRERMLAYALEDQRLETGDLLAILEREGLKDVLDAMKQVTLAFSFLNPKSDADQAKRDLATVIDALVAGPEIKAGIAEARDRWVHSADERDYARFEQLLRTKREVDESFRNAFMTDENEETLSV